MSDYEAMMARYMMSIKKSLDSIADSLSATGPEYIHAAETAFSYFMIRWAMSKAESEQASMIFRSELMLALSQLDKGR